MAKKYRETFLTKPRKIISDREKADKSLFIYAALNEKEYYLSYLGIINGFLSKIGLLLAVHVDFDTMLIEECKIQRKRRK